MSDPVPWNIRLGVYGMNRGAHLMMTNVNGELAQSNRFTMSFAQTADAIRYPFLESLKQPRVPGTEMHALYATT
jgi:hypothetical protein